MAVDGLGEADWLTNISQLGLLRRAIAILSYT